MNKNRMHWAYSPSKVASRKLLETEKKYITDYFQPLVEKFKKQYIAKKPDKQFNYLVDVYSKWDKNYFYLCEKFKADYPNRLVDEFEEKFVRLKCIGNDQFQFSYFRHTGKWVMVADNFTLKECLEMILSSPVFHPIS